MLQRTTIEKAWPAIAEDAARLLTSPHQNSPRDLFNDCKAGVACAFQSPDGPIVVTIKIHPRTKQRELHLRWGNSTTDKPGAFERNLPAIRKMAQDLKCAAVVFDSVRKGWIRKAAKAGFAIRNIEFALEV